jgi:hypothetical protein
MQGKGQLNHHTIYSKNCQERSEISKHSPLTAKFSETILSFQQCKIAPFLLDFGHDQAKAA